MGLAACALLWPMLRLVGLGPDLAWLFTIVVALAFACSGAADYLHGRALYRQLAIIADAEDDVLELARELKPPGYPEGDVVQAALARTVARADTLVSEATARERDHREFVEAWVHEVKTPLAAADLMIENLDDARLGPLSSELDRVDTYVEQALFYARSSSVENDYLVRTCTLEQLVGSVLKSRAHQLVGAGVSVGMEGLGRQVFTDPKWMQFILGQIVDNAVRYRRSEGARIDFSARTLDVGLADERVVLSVRDNGLGISAADVGRVFEKGFTGENGRRYAKSTGIGLFLVRTLCEKMGLSVGISSVAGAWTCVEVTFPTNRMRLIAD